MCDVVQKLPLSDNLLHCKECGRDFPLGEPYVIPECTEAK